MSIEVATAGPATRTNEESNETVQQGIVRQGQSIYCPSAVTRVMHVNEWLHDTLATAIGRSEKSQNVIKNKLYQVAAGLLHGLCRGVSH